MKYPRSRQLGCKDIGIIKSEFVARSQFISVNNSDIAIKFRLCITFFKTTHPYMFRHKIVVYFRTEHINVVHFRTEHKSFQLFRTVPKLSYPSREAQNILSICTLHTLKGKPG